MYYIVFNDIGAGLMVLAAIVGCVVGTFFGMLAGLIVAALMMVATDVLIRIDINRRTKRRKRNPWFLVAPTSGGHFCYLPIWVCCIFPLAGIYHEVFVKNRPANPPAQQAENNPPPPVDNNPFPVAAAIVNPNPQPPPPPEPMIFDGRALQITPRQEGPALYSFTVAHTYPQPVSVDLQVAFEQTNGRQKTPLRLERWPAGEKVSLPAHANVMYLTFEGEVTDSTRSYPIYIQWRLPGALASRGPPGQPSPDLAKGIKDLDISAFPCNILATSTSAQVSFRNDHATELWLGNPILTVHTGNQVVRAKVMDNSRWRTGNPLVGIVNLRLGTNPHDVQFKAEALGVDGQAYRLMGAWKVVPRVTAAKKAS